MKRCIVLILSVMMMLPLILTANAADDAQALTKREAQELVAEAFNYNYKVRCDTSNYRKSGVFTILLHDDISDIKISCWAAHTKQ